MDRDVRLFAERYELGSPIGRGGMGDVLAGEDRRLGRPVAVKLLRADLAGRPGARRRFEAEARSAARLSHPNVVTVYDSGEQEGIPFLVMERLPGRTLTDEIAAGPFPVERALTVARDILSALGAAHSAGILHRDIKPGNVLLTDDGRVKVSDFGIAKTLDAPDQTLTGELLGTALYLAPERLAGKPASPRSDLYSVGALLYEILSGRRPFEGDTPLEQLHAVEQGRVAPLGELRPELPAAVVAAVERAMAVEPLHRFASATEMAAALETRKRDLDPTAPNEDVATTVPMSLEPTVPVASARRQEMPTAIMPLNQRAQTRSDARTRRPSRVPVGRRTPRSRVINARRGLVVAGLIVAFGGAFGTVIAISQGSSDGQPIPSTATDSSTPASQKSLPGPVERSIEQLEHAVTR